MTKKFEPATGHTLAAYARRLRRANRTLTRADAKRLAEKHETERLLAHQRNTH